MHPGPFIKKFSSNFLFLLNKPLNLVAPALGEEIPPLLLRDLTIIVLEVVEVVFEYRLPISPRVELLPHPGGCVHYEEHVAVHRELLLKKYRYSYGYCNLIVYMMGLGIET